ncbi:MAG: ankyrin repeat domain-containing protein [Acidobacteriota bacterium]|nr:ankyrin repeat domain-containing protein [Acidobacteriota bacterium]
MGERLGPWLLAFVVVGGIQSTQLAHAQTAASGGELLAAARSGAAAEVTRLLNEGGDPNETGPDGTTALHWAVQRDDDGSTQQLIAAGAEVNVASRYGVTPLALAAANGNLALVDALLTAGADPAVSTPGGDTPLMFAARTGRSAVVQALLHAGADVDARETWKGQTALMWAAAEGNADAVVTLVAAGADIEARSTGRLTPLLFAVREGRTDAVGALLDAGAKINATTRDGTTPLALAVVNSHFELAELLLEGGADPNLPDPRGSVLHALSWIRRPGSGRPPLPTGTLDSLVLARALLGAGANPNVRINWKEIPFEVDLGIVKPPPGISVGRNFLSFVGATPFYLAAKHADVDLMQLLVEYGADPLATTGQHITPLMAAAGVGFWDGESPGPLNGTPEPRRLEAVTLAVELGNDIHAVTDFGDTRLEGDGRTLLLRHPLNLDALDPQRDRGDMRWDGSTALHGAAMLGSNLIVQYLLDVGADINTPNTLGWTPLMIARGVFVANTEKAWPDTVELLRERGATSN